jgi:mercuric reductase
MKKYDLIIIGGGAGAFGAAIRANDLHANTALINAGLPLGGTCVNVGCVPSKTLLYAGEILHLAKHHGIPGIKIGQVEFDFRKVVADELALVERLRREKYEKVLSSLNHVALLEGNAKFISKDTVRVNGQDLSADKFIIATGSTASVPPIEGLHEAGFLTHIEALKLSFRLLKRNSLSVSPLFLLRRGSLSGQVWK